MKPLKYLAVVVLAALILLPVLSASVSTPTPTPMPGPTATLVKPGLPPVPITYPGDTDATIIRRAQWVKAAKKEGKVVWWGTPRPREGAQIIAEFNKVYPFIKVDFWSSTADELATKVEAEFIGGRTSLDVYFGELLYHRRWREMGIFVPYIDIIPGIEKMDKKAYSRYGDWVRPGSVLMLPAYNTNLVSAAEAPKSWKDLLDPKWKGQIGLSRSMRTWAILALADGGWGIEKTEEFLIKLRGQDLKWGPGQTAVMTLMVAGEFKISGVAFLHHVFSFQDKGAPVGLVRVNPVPIASSGLSLSKKAPHPNAARLFLEWLLSPQGLGVWEKVRLEGSPFPGSGTRQAKGAEGLDLIGYTEEAIMKDAELGLQERFAKIIGMIPK